MTDIAFHITDLAANSLRAGADAIDIALSLDGTQLKLAVTDNGCGIPAERMATLFDRWAEGLEAAPAAYGMGLGLPICRLGRMLLDFGVDCLALAGRWPRAGLPAS